MRLKSAQAAAMGAAFLDVVSPGWWRRVRLRELNMAVGCQCVLGQEFGDYEKGKATLGLTDDEAVLLGMETRKPHPFWEPDYWALTRAWRDEIRRRRRGVRKGRQR